MWARLNDHLIELFKLRVSECGDRKRLQIEEFRGWRTFLRQNQMPEGNREKSLAPDPSVRNHSDEVLRREIKLVIINVMTK